MPFSTFSQTKSINFLILFFALAKLIFHLITNDLWSFHRDEFLYLSLGQNLEWGYWSNPPFVGFMSWLTQGIFGGAEPISVAELRFVPAVFATGLTVFTLLIVKELGGKIPAIFAAGIAVMVCPGFLRPGMMFMPVIFEIFFWTFFSWLVVKYVKTEQSKFLYWLGAAIGIAFLNKYSTVFYVLGILIGLVLTEHRKLYKNKALHIAVGIAVLICIPNIIWQANLNFPVFSHMGNLRETQLVNVSFMSFIGDQILMCIPALIIWLSGFYWLFKNKNPFKILGWIGLSVILILLISSGKGYYTLGIYPMLIAAGSVQIGDWFFGKKQDNKKESDTFRGIRFLPKKRHAGYILILIFALISGWILMPFSAPILSQEKMIAFCNNVKSEYHFDTPMRWEDGQIHELPQDYADMIGWEELAEIVETVYSERKLNSQNCLVYAENYGQAGSVEHFYRGKFKVQSFADTYRLKVLDEIPETVTNLIYINDELGEDVKALFEKTEIAGSIQNPLARERGTSVYLLSKPRTPFKEFWEGRVREVKAYFGI